MIKEEELEELFEEHDEEFLEFKKVKNKMAKGSDLHAFMKLDKMGLVKGTLIGWAGHDEISLDIDIDKFCKIAAEDDVIELIRCGIRYSEDSLMMFV